MRFSYKCLFKVTESPNSASPANNNEAIGIGPSLVPHRLSGLKGRGVKMCESIVLERWDV